MVAILLDNAPGISAVYAESGTGKSVCTTLAVIEVAGTQKDDMFVVLQGNLNETLEQFLGISRATLTADIAPAFFSALRKKNVRLHLVFDNVLESGVQSDLVKDMVKELARGATEHGHQVIFTVQAAEAAESVGFLNGATPRIARQQNHSYGAYRWTETDTTKLVETMDKSPTQRNFSGNLQYQMKWDFGDLGIPNCLFHLV